MRSRLTGPDLAAIDYGRLTADYYKVGWHPDFLAEDGEGSHVGGKDRDAGRVFLPVVDPDDFRRSGLCGLGRTPGRRGARRYRRAAHYDGCAADYQGKRKSGRFAASSRLSQSVDAGWCVNHTNASDDG